MSLRGLSPALIVALALSPAAFAHDIWLHARDFTLERGETLIVHQLVGAELDTDLSSPESTTELPVLMDMTPRFELLTTGGTVDLMAELPDLRSLPLIQPVLERRLDFDGLALVAMDHSLIYTLHTDEEFLEYLDHEGFDPAEFRGHMDAAELQTEGYGRSMKSLIRVGRLRDSAASDLHGRALGQTLEILLLQDPYRLEPGDVLEVQVLFEGEPLANRVVKAYNAPPGEEVSQQATPTDARGTARFTLDRAGLWLVRLVHLAPCSPESPVDCSDATWESYWSSYSFELD